MDPRRAAARANGGIFILVTVIVVLTATCAVAIHRSAAAGDVASVAFVAVSYAALLLLHRTLGAYETAAGEPEDDAAAEHERVRLRRRIWALSTLLTVLFAWKVTGVDHRKGSSGVLTSLGLGVLAFNSALAINNVWDDVGSVAFVLAANAGLVLLFLCLRAFEQGGRARDGAKTTAAVWALTTLLTAMFSYAAKMAPLIVGGLVFLCLREFERAQIGLGGRYAELLKLGFGIAACDSALAHHHAHGGPGSLAFVFIAYVGFLTLTWLFLIRRFDGRARGTGQ